MEHRIEETGAAPLSEEDARELSGHEQAARRLQVEIQALTDEVFRAGMEHSVGIERAADSAPWTGEDALADLEDVQSALGSEPGEIVK